MRYMIIRKADAETEGEGTPLPSQELLEAMGKYNQEMIDAGVMVAGEGLKPSREGMKIKFSGGKPTIIDGPFTEAKELIAGFTIINVKSKEEALEWVKRWPPLDAGGNVELEVRPLFELEDFPGEGEEWRENERAFRERTNQ